MGWDSLVDIGSGLLSELGTVSGLTSALGTVGSLWSANESAKVASDYADIIAGSASKQDAIAQEQWNLAKGAMKAEAAARQADAEYYNTDEVKAARNALSDKQLSLQQQGLDVMGQYAYGDGTEENPGIQGLYYQNMLGDIQAYGDTQETRDSILTAQYANQLAGQGLNANLIKAQQADLDTYNANRDIIQSYYDQSRDGVDIGERVTQAKADVAQAFAGQQAATNRSMARMGVNPNSGRFADQNRLSATDRARSMAGAATTARTSAEQENYSRLNNATNVLKGMAPAGYNNTLQAPQNTGVGLYSGGGLQAPNFNASSVGASALSGMGRSNRALAGLAGTAANSASQSFAAAGQGLAGLVYDNAGNTKQWANTSIS